MTEFLLIFATTLFDLNTWLVADWLLPTSMFTLGAISWALRPRRPIKEWIKDQPLRLGTVLMFLCLTVLMIAWQPINMVHDLGHLYISSEMRGYMYYINYLRWLMIGIVLWVLTLAYKKSELLKAIIAFFCVYVLIGILVHLVAAYGIWYYTQ